MQLFNLSEQADEVLKHLHQLWGFNVHLDSVRDDAVTESFHCPPQPEKSEEAS